MFSPFKKNRIIRVFAEELASELYSTLPPAIVAEYRARKSKKAEQQFTKMMDKATLRLSQFKEINKLGVYSKAKLHQLFLYKLIALGYEKELANEINQILLLKTP